MMVSNANKSLVRLASLLVLSITLAGIGQWPCSRANAQVSAPRTSFAIGYLPQGSDLGDADPLLATFKSHLENQAQVSAALERLGIDSIILSPCDGPRDMVQRMNHGEFDMVFATAVVYVRQRGPYADPMFQTYLTGDLKMLNDAGIVRQGVIIAGPASKLFHTEAPPSGPEIAEALQAHPLAVASGDSAAGYLYPRYRMLKQFGIDEGIEYWFCGSDAEVVKHVISGLVPIGACSEGALQATLPRIEHRDRLYRVLFATDQFPTNPVVLHERFTPSRSDLGREIKTATRTFFNMIAPREGLRMEQTTERAYDSMRTVVSALESPKKMEPIQEQPPEPALPSDQPAQPVLPPATTPTATPTPTPVPELDLSPALPDWMGGDE